MRTETDPVTGTQAGAAPLGAEERRPPGAKSVKADRLRTRRSWPSHAPPVHGRVSASNRRGGGMYTTGRGRRLLRREGLYTSWPLEHRKGTCPACRGFRLVEGIAGLVKWSASPAVSENPCTMKAFRRDLGGLHPTSSVPRSKVLDWRKSSPPGGGAVKNIRAAGIQPQRREELLMAARSLEQVGTACRALGVPRATFYRRHRMVPGRQQPRPTPARALCEAERERVLDTLGCDALSTAHRPRSSPHSWTKGSTCARSARCIGSWLRTSRCANDASELHQARAGGDRTEPDLRW